VRSVNGADFGIRCDIAVHTHNLGVKATLGEFTFVQGNRVFRWVFPLSGNPPL